MQSDLVEGIKALILNHIYRAYLIDTVYVILLTSFRLFILFGLIICNVLKPIPLSLKKRKKKEKKYFVHKFVEIIKGLAVS